jgi:2-methylcitrate dehydratase PrpD
MAGYDQDAAASIYFDRGQHATSICGAIGSAAAAATVSRLDADHVAHAMAIAASMASGIIEANRTGGTVKRLHCGWAAQAGVTAAGLAAQGITGPPTVFEGRFGLLQAFLGDDANPAAVTEGLGEQWEVPSIFFKPYPANHFTHAGIDAALALAADGLRPDDVEHATLGVAPATVRTIGEPLATKQTPETGYQAQFSGPYTVTAALFGGSGLGLGLADFTDALASDPERRAVMARVDVVGSDRCGTIYPHQFPAELSVTTTDGARLQHSVLVNRGGPDNPLTDDELARKFDDNVDGLLDGAAAAEVRKRALSLGTEPDVHALMAAVADTVPCDG